MNTYLPRQSFSRQKTKSRHHLSQGRTTPLRTSYDPRSTPSSDTLWSRRRLAYNPRNASGWEIVRNTPRIARVPAVRGELRRTARTRGLRRRVGNLWRPSDNDLELHPPSPSPRVVSARRSSDAAPPRPPRRRPAFAVCFDRIVRYCKSRTHERDRRASVLCGR